MKQILFTLVLVLSTFASWAYDVKIDGIYYNLNREALTAEVAQTYDWEDPRYKGRVDIPSTIVSDGVSYSVTSIGASAFWSCYDLTSVTIPYGVTSIGDGAFACCFGLTSVTFPNSVTSIGENVFEGCNLASPVYNETIFACLPLSYEGDYQIPQGITLIASGAFYDCTGLTSVSIPNSVTSIGNNAFEQCYGLASVTIPDNVTSLGNCAFAGCQGLTSVTIGNGVTNFGIEVFLGCTGLTSVNISSIEAWCNLSFYNNDSNPLNYAHNLYLNGELVINLEIPDDVISIPDCAFIGCSCFTSVSIPNSVTSIGGKAFSDCTGLTSISIGNGVTSIGGVAFMNCTGLTTITIPSSVTSIGFGTFYGCSELREIHSNNITPPTCGYHVFDGVKTANCKLYVPTGSKEDYAFADGWCDFVNIIEETVTDPSGEIATPTIAYENQKLVFSSATEGVEYTYTITSEDIKSSLTDCADGMVNLSATYRITAYAKKDGKTSAPAVATLVWATATLTPVDPASAPEISVDAQPLLITQQGGEVTISGITDGTLVTVCSVNGSVVTSSRAVGNSASLDLSSHIGKVAIINVGGKSAKVMID